MRFPILVLLLFIFSSTSAQQAYSYVGERIFDDPTDLLGYNFRPFKIDIPGNYEPQKIEAGEYSFGITRNRLYVSGDLNIRGLYEINNIAPAIYGFKITLLNPSNPNNRGHFKVILNKLLEAEAVIFKAESKSAEYIFHLPDATKTHLKKEQNYFTDLGETIVEDPDSLWGMKLFPYFRVTQSDQIQNRLYVTDSTVISFEERIIVEEKKQRKGLLKRKKNKKAKEDAAPKTTSEEKPPPSKITKEYFVKISSILNYNDGRSEKKVWEYPIKEIEEREDTSARKNEERFQLAIKISKRKEIYVYLNGDRTISSFEADGLLYLMRGH